MGSVFVLLLRLVTLIITAVVITLCRATVGMVLFATSVATRLTALLAGAVAPNRVGHHVQNLDGSNWIITGDDQFTAPWAFFSCLVANDDAKACTRVQCRRKGIVD